ncbi:MAG: right-handed parallel beta-helix repeat-containing protein, partial [Chloroflexota bacterium]|nr:right-handed parallel beta-helix repeat-containing protein [Chloroflexota bacterium]
MAADGSGDASSLSQALEDVDNGGHIRLSPGLYEGGVDIDTDVTISGAEDGSSVVLALGGLPGISVHDARLTLQYVSLRSDDDNDAPAPAGIRISGGSATIDGCSISDVRVGILIQDGAHADVTDCSIEEATESAIKVVGEDTDAVIRMNRITHSEVGLAIATGASARVEDNRISGGKWGLRAEGGAIPTVENNTITDVEKTAVFVSGPDSAATIRSNVISRNGWGIEIAEGAAAVIEGNTVADQANTGIWIGGIGGEVKVRDNEITGNEWGVYAVDGAAPLVEGNTISGQAKTGVAVEEAGTAPVV